MERFQEKMTPNVQQVIDLYFGEEKSSLFQLIIGGGA